MTPQQRLLNRLASALEPLSREMRAMFGEGAMITAGFTPGEVIVAVLPASSPEVNSIPEQKSETPAPILKKSRKGGER